MFRAGELAQTNGGVGVASLSPTALRLPFSVHTYGHPTPTCVWQDEEAWNSLKTALSGMRWERTEKAVCKECELVS